MINKKTYCHIDHTKNRHTKTGILPLISQISQL